MKRVTVMEFVVLADWKLQYSPRPKRYSGGVSNWLNVLQTCRTALLKYAGLNKFSEDIPEHIRHLANGGVSLTAIHERGHDIDLILGRLIQCLE